MSAYIMLLTPMTDQESLIAAIVDQGFDAQKIVQSEISVALRGWQRDRRANIILRKEHTKDSYNDIGFLSSATGYVAILSDDHPHYGRAWLSKINASYQTHWTAKQARLAAEERRRIEEERQQLVEAQRQAVHQRARKMGYRVQETRVGETIRLVLLKRTY